MARWRVSSRTVWRRAGGRRGAEPAISTTSAELGLPWDDAPATTQAGFISAIGLGALRRWGSVPSGGGGSSFIQRLLLLGVR